MAEIPKIPQPHPHLVILVDNSFSVSNYIIPYMNTVNSMIMEQRKINPNTLISVITFHEEPHTLIMARPAYTLNNPISLENFRVCGTTAFYDCLDQVLTKIHTGISPDTELTFLVLTDGEDNYSKKSNFMKVKDKLSRIPGRYIFLGVTEESVNLAKFIGFHVNILYKPTPECFRTIIQIVNPVLSNKINGDINMDELEKIMNSMSI